MERKKILKLPNIFDTQKEGKGVKKGEVKDPSFKNFFKYYGRSITKLLNTNLMFTLLCLPVFSLFFAIAGFTNLSAPAASGTLFGPVRSAIISGNINPVTMSLFGAVGVQTDQSVRLTIPTLIFFGIAALIIFTWGYANTGMFYVIRNLQKGEPVFMFADFKQTIKQNKLQSLLLGIIDLAIIGLTFYDLQFFAINSSLSSMYSVMFWICVFIGIMYLIMRVYLYLMLVTFDLSIYKMFKNGLIFVFIGLKRNIPAILGMLLVIAFNIFIFIGFLPVGIVLPFVLTFATCAYIGVYAAYPKIKEIMIDPYYNENGEETEEE
ncbi:MAG: DUF624 domain-containing protein [Clostridia bacterium]|nr:DUF624 domain-containing protein [Clostridia bacterium]